ncbi:entericidin A/B family lipoprotein [Alkalilimnicola sp. S0819]|uniref:entericidin A/B family lipoprotein n=1 Tax=Alkalilimnicola sp. S0819 TaxID=2613922 RepID=UPI001261D840|nr:entericidin A/B family lipoprotein [Alkalilimnicola sp. S0819]KAB7619544.1 entericidin A/B family lipoprotein [Alkalilimnicola sp. S0819]MPQ17651.1 entericidin A/B family lipoprotein [Alkalilimnicola sp. S0819]
MKYLSLGQILAVLLLAGAGVGLAGCNTVEGVGEDVSAAGDKLDEAAEERGAR